MAAPVVRLTANLSPEVAKLLDDVAERLGTSKTEALNRAIATFATLNEQKGRVVVKNGPVEREVSVS